MVNSKDCPQELQAGLNRYVNERCQTGSFLYAILTNNLREAVMRADDKNIRLIPEIVCFVYNEIPGKCWGSVEKVEAWLKGE
jgi:hypothetical protein